MEVGLEVPQWKKELMLKKRQHAPAGKASVRKTRAASSSDATPVQVGLVSRTAALFQHGVRDPTSKKNQSEIENDDCAQVYPSDVLALIEEPNRITSSEVQNIIMKEPAFGNDRARRPKNNGMQANAEWNNRVFRAQSHDSMIKGRNGEQSDSSEELEYGPGIVNKLRNRWEFLNNTCRQRKDVKRPTLASLRRANSMENVLDSDMVVKTESFERKVKPPNNHSVEAVKNQDSSLESCIKKAQSMEAITFLGEMESKSKDTNMDKILSNDNIVIIDQQEPGKPKKALGQSRSTMKRASVPCITREELPAPHTVRQMKRFYEPNSSNRYLRKGSDSSLMTCRKLSSSTGNLVTKPNPPLPIGNFPHGKPVRKISPVPSQNGERYPKIPKKPSLPEKPKMMSPVAVTPTLKKPTSQVVRSNLMNGQLSTGSDGESSYASSEDDVFDSDHSNGKRISRTAIDNISRDSVSMSFNFKNQNSDSIKKNHLPGVTRDPFGRDETDKSIPPRWPGVGEQKPVVAPKIGVVEPIIKSVQHKNEKNAMLNEEPIKKEFKQDPVQVKREERTVEEIKPKPALETIRPPLPPKGETQTSSFPPRPSKITNVEARNQAPSFVGSAAPFRNTGNDPSKWHQKSSNTMVFNFTADKSKETPDYINDIPKGKFHIAGVTSSDSADEEELRRLACRPPSPCTFEFINASIVINGKSSIKNSPRPERRKVYFDDNATTTFEYPSEKSLSECPDDDRVSAKSPSPTTSPSNCSELSSYIPSKHHMQQFELGTTRSTPKNNPQPKTQEEESSSSGDFLKPATEGSQWSDAMSSDILF